MRGGGRKVRSSKGHLYCRSIRNKAAPFFSVFFLTFSRVFQIAKMFWFGTVSWFMLSLSRLIQSCVKQIPSIPCLNLSLSLSLPLFCIREKSSMILLFTQRIFFSNISFTFLPPKIVFFLQHWTMSSSSLLCSFKILSPTFSSDSFYA